MIKGIPNPLGQALSRIAREGDRFKTSDVDTLDRIVKENDRLKESDVEIVIPDVLTGKKKPRQVRDWEKRNEGG